MAEFGQRRPGASPDPGEARLSKRSQTVSLVLLVGAAGAAFALGHADPSQREEDALVYPSEQACVSGAVRSAEDCREAFRTARDLYPRIAPRYATNAECEQHHGRDHCTIGGGVSPEAAGFFIPVLAGAMLGRTVAQNLPVQPLFDHRPDEREERQGSGGHGGGYCTSSGGRVWAASGGNAASARVASSVARTRDTSARVVRGGLGSTGRSFAASSHGSSHGISGG
jgi:uncharacterized protein YgiB involved in biofilm formation